MALPDEIPVPTLAQVRTLEQRLAAVEARPTGGTTTTSSVLPRYTGGTKNCIVVPTVINGQPAWRDATTTDQAALNDAAFLADDDQVYPLNGVHAPIAGQPANTTLMLRTPPAPGQSNLEPVPNPFPPEKEFSETFTEFYPGKTSPSGGRLITARLAIPLFKERPFTLFTVAEYDFKPGADPGVVYDISGNGKHGTVLNGTWTSRGLQVTPEVKDAGGVVTTPGTKVALPFPPPGATFSIAFALRRANTSANHTVFSSTTSAGPRWRLGGTDQTFYTDATQASYRNSTGVAANTTTIISATFEETAGGTTIRAYRNGQPIGSGTLTTKITALAANLQLARTSSGGEWFNGEYIYQGVGANWTDADHLAVRDYILTKTAGRPA